MGKPTAEYRATYLKANFPRMHDNTVLLLEAIARAEKGLPRYARDFHTFKLYWGLTPEEPPTYEELGRRFCVTRERIRQRCLKAERLIRNPKWWIIDGASKEAVEHLARKVQNLDLSIRTKRGLKKAGVQLVLDLVEKTAYDLLFSYNGPGLVSFSEIEMILAGMDLSLDMRIHPDIHAAIREMSSDTPPDPSDGGGMFSGGIPEPGGGMFSKQ